MGSHKTRFNLRNGGFTLGELVASMAVGVILLTVALPSFTEAIQVNRTASQTNNFIRDLNLARSEAVKRGDQVTVRKSGNDWEDGWTVFTDLDGDGQLDSGVDQALRVNTLPNPKFSLRTGTSFTTWLAYLPSGVATGVGTFRLCRSDNDTAKSRSISINNSGRVAVYKGTAECP